MKKTYLLLAAFTLFLGGCTSLTKANYDKIQGGMTYNEVVAIIGKPDQCTEVLALSNCGWTSGDASVNVSFIGGKVTLTTATGLR